MKVCDSQCDGSDNSHHIGYLFYVVLCFIQYNILFSVGTFRTAPGGLVSSLPLSLPISGDVEQDYFIQLPPQYYIDLHFTEWIGVYTQRALYSVAKK